MKNLIALSLIILTTTTSGGKNMYKNFKNLLKQINTGKADEDDVKKFISIATNKGTIPITHRNKAVFIYYDENARSVEMRGDATGWSKGVKMKKAGSTSLFYLEQTYPEDARLDYKFVVDGRWILDPLNPYKCLGGFGPNSELRMPKFKFSWWVTETPSRTGTLQDVKMRSDVLNETRKITLYLPPDHSPNTSYPIVYFQDGGDYLQMGEAKKVLDNLISKREIPPVIAVFVHPKDRNIEYTLNEKYARFFAEELIPFIESQWFSQGPNKRLIVGDSLGALISMFIAFKYPETFKKVIAQSPAVDFYYNRKMSFLGYNIDQKIVFADEIAKSPCKGTEIYMCLGTFELGDKTGRKANFKALIDLLKSKKYTVKAVWYNQGHSWGMWKDDLGKALIHFLGGKK